MHGRDFAATPDVIFTPHEQSAELAAAHGAALADLAAAVRSSAALQAITPKI